MADNTDDPRSGEYLRAGEAQLRAAGRDPRAGVRYPHEDTVTLNGPASKTRKRRRSK